jgi:alginate O-acetyltransferase complex protein AlgJ
MAIGVGRMLGHTLPENFDNPLRATSISDFWQRWHMTLTAFITSYLFTPIVRSWGRVTTRKAMAAMIIAMTIAGAWHGSGWVFLVFGLIHGVGLALRLAWKASKRKMPDGPGTALTFLFVTFAFIFFRSPDLKIAGNVLASLGGAHGMVSQASVSDNPVVIALWSNWGIPAACCMLAWGLAFLGPTSTQVSWTSPLRPRLAIGTLPLVAISLLFINSAPSRGFIYADRRPRLKTFLSSTAGFIGEGGSASEKVVVGRNGWLYYSPGLTYAFGQPFLNADVLRSRAKQLVDNEREAEPNPDPRPALLHLVEDCQRWGIHVVLVPVPDKAMLQPLQVPSHSLTDGAVPDNPSFGILANELQENGGDVFEWRPKSVRRGEVRFLKRDTHWNPAFMEEYAARLASHVLSLGVLPPTSSNRRFFRRSERRDNPGDLTFMLKLLPGIAHFPSETVETHPVIDATTGQPATADPRAQILLLGDSFTNIYSLSSLGWGEHAGLAEQLAYNLNQPLDVLAMNGAAATAIRLELVRAAKAGGLRGKLVLIYEFAIADLAVENWRPMRIPAPPMVLSPPPAAGMKLVERDLSAESSNGSPPASIPIPAKTMERQSLEKQEVKHASVPASPQSQSSVERNLQVMAQITFMSKIPEPGVALYRDCVGIAKLLVLPNEQGDLANQSILVAFWVMRDNVFSQAARYKVGDTLKMSLIPFEKADPIVRGTQRSDDTHDYDSPLFWATQMEVVPK